MKNILLVIGHNKTSGGAIDVNTKLNEYEFYKKVCSSISQKGYDIDTIIRRPLKSYSQQMSEVVSISNSKPYYIVIELHFNASENKNVNGSEVLCYKNSKLGKKYSLILSSMFAKKLGIKDRGIVEISSTEDRGGYGIVKSKNTYVLIEPFFGSCLNENVTIDNISNVLCEFISSFQNEVIV